MKTKQIKKTVLKFEAKKGSHITDNQAGIYGKRLYELIKTKGKSTITAIEVLEDAKNKSSPYHDYFEWDNKNAGESWRLTQARHLINSIVTVKVRTSDEQPIQIRAFVNIVDDEGEKGYVPIDVAISTPKQASQIIQQALREARSWHDRYEEYQELAKIHKAIQEGIEEFTLEGD